ncbi:MAG: hypothetical protein M1829_006088 [Trizodia sp. TS-e1964]|nr:MAG: hypothetical protein M1829_006088 [Trizodia sp. TS-e1964]
MTTIRNFQPSDLYKFNLTNLDPLTETYDFTFYFTYLAKWPDMFKCVVDSEDRVVAYIMAKVETNPEYDMPLHAHITAVTVAAAYRRMGIASTLCALAEQAGNNNNAWFIDLYVRVSNKAAIEMYQRLGYSIYRRVVAYYIDEPVGTGEDAFDMRKSLVRDVKREHVRERGEQFEVLPINVP